MGCCNVRCGLIAGAVIGAVVAILGGILIPVGRNIIKGTVEKEAVLEPGTTAHDNWVSAGATVYRQFWIFDVKNPQEIVNDGATPVVVEKGPYTYKTRYLPRDNITYGDITVSFVLPAGAIFIPSMSVGLEEDNVTCLNLVVAGAYSLVPEEVLEKFSKLSLFQHRTVKELLWGYRDPTFFIETGLFVSYNGSTDGIYTVFTGKDDISKVGLIDSWREKKKLDFWEDQYCDMINGTDASSFPPFVDKSKPLYFFSSDICRSVSASFQQSMDLKGIEVYRFTLQPNTLAAPTDNPDNHCFCRDQKVTKNCSLAGALDISSCQSGKPIYISLPHFLYGSPILQSNVLGLNPSEEHHMTYMDVEPITGFTLGFAKRIQMNMMYGPSQKVKIFKKIKDYTIFPIAWLNETAVLDQETADMFKEQLISRIRMLEMLQYSLLGIGVSVFVLCLIGFCVVRNKRGKLY
ncbi:platelet glycoprotein 4 [Takifugu rubripes]|uniref:platelet glycoprotein 4 n=1 Tax=Takifugu rubripes TaxID=31033 RepID=UPI0011458B28|nr:platelet glycoprotein 4 [Takifugu rubripes]